MEKKEFIEALTELTDQEDIIQAGRKVNELRTAFEDYILEETRKYQVAELKAKEDNAEFNEEDWITPLKEEFYSIYGPFKEKRKELIDSIRKEEEENLRKKRSLINQLKAVIEDEENIGAAFAKHKEINEKWKEVGDIPRDKRHDVQQEYSRLLEEFFYNMNIYKQIKDYDFQKNYDAKKAIIEELKKLEKVELIKEVESNLKRLQNEWEDIGPTKQELWEELKEDYWSTVKGLYDRIREHYDERREQMRENIELKKQIITKVEDILGRERDSVKAWNKQTKEVLELQKDWKKIGFGPKKENDAVWKTFRGLCDQFFAEKSEFFKDVHEEFDAVAEQKEKLIQKVDELKDSTDWKNTTHKIINIQKDWKKLGSAGQKNENRLWKQFRAACDHFFDAKKAHFAAKDEEFVDNLNKKKELIKEIEAFKLPTDKQKAIDALKAFAEQFAAIGFVPRNEKDAVFKAYKDAIDAHYKALKLEGEEKAQVMFEARLNTLKGSGNAKELFQKEKQAIRNEIDQIKQQIIQYENNLGFFSNSKGSNALKDQVEGNIKAEQEKIDMLKAKLKMIPNE
tara:strand:+ start:59884 stop:61587 length:1704 start_codon:yes stop_codon:yes gene_type:complete